MTRSSRPSSVPRPPAAAESVPQRVNNTFTVTTVTDGVAGSLRAAITSANLNPGLDLITFAIGSGFVSLTPGSQLPDITDPVVIDGTTQPGFAGTPIVELAGTSAGPNASALPTRPAGAPARADRQPLADHRLGGFGIVPDVQAIT
jgi:hypothetical protein